MTALKDLLAKVEAGWPPDIDTPYMTPFHAVWPDWRAQQAWMANQGSLDAAKALHEAVLPGWAPSIGQNVHHCYWFAHLLRAENGSIVGDYEGSAIDNPARAWLIAIIRALIAQECEA